MDILEKVLPGNDRLVSNFLLSTRKLSNIFVDPILSSLPPSPQKRAKVGILKKQVPMIN